MPKTDRALARRRSEFAPTWLDRFLIGLFPRWGLQRYRARSAALLNQRHYDSAAAGRRTEGWTRRSTDANTAAQGSIIALRELSRDLLRNNAWARRGVSVIAENTVGWGIGARVQGEAKQAMDLWDRWASSTRCDYGGRLDFAGLQDLVMQTVATSGEALILRHVADSQDRLTIPLRLQVLEPDHLDLAKTGPGATTGGWINQGVEFDRRGRRVAYWLFESHPGATGVLPTAGNVSKRFSAEDVLHIYRMERPGQLRGIPWLAAAIVRIKDFDDFEDAQLMQQKVAACFGAFVQDTEGLGVSPLGDPSKMSGDETKRIETLEPGQIQYLQPGKSVTFAQPSQPTNEAFSERQLRAVAANLGITYEDLTGDYSRVNFSSARMARLAHWRNVDSWRWKMLIPQFCVPAWGWAMDLAGALYGFDAPLATWAGPPMPMLEPDKEGTAYSRLMRNGVMTLRQVLRERGEDPDLHLQEIAETNKRLDALKIWLDSDPRRTSAAGLTQERVGAGAGGAKPGGEDASEEEPADSPT